MRDNASMASLSLHLTGEKGPDKLLSTSPLALLLGMVLDQQVPMEWAFRGPYELSQRIGGTLTAEGIASMDPETLATIFSSKPALHRYPGSMAKRTQEVSKVIVDTYGGDVEEIWKGAENGSDLLRRMKALPGFGEMKAKIFIALLGKQLGITTPGWEKACAPYGEKGSFRSVADIVDLNSLEKVREFKAAAKKAAKASR